MKDTEKLKSLKKLAATVYLLQVLSFAFAGLAIAGGCGYQLHEAG